MRTTIRTSLWLLGVLAVFVLGLGAGIVWSQRHGAAPAQDEKDAAASPANKRSGDMPAMPGMSAIDCSGVFCLRHAPNPKRPATSEMTARFTAATPLRSIAAA